VRSNDQLGELIYNFNEMAVSLERLKKEEVLKLQFESELRVAQRVHEYLFPAWRQLCLGPQSPATLCRRGQSVVIYMTSSI
jgi:hypothetical protein